MAINSFDLICDKKPAKSIRTSCSSKDSNSVPCRLMKIDFATDGSIISGSSKHGKLLKNKDLKSPYLTGDRVQLHSRVTEKRLVHKKAPDFSSFPLAVNIYKANSDEFNSLKRKNKKTKKSVLTLPNDPAPVPQTCTVSDMNDSEYFNGDDNNNNRKVKAKRRLPYQNNRKARGRNKDFEFYDRDARYCSQLNIDLDCSSTDMIKHFQGDGKCISKEFVSGKSQRDQDFKAHDVWAVLRNINRFQFRPSPPMSEESLVSPRKKKGSKKKRGHPKNTRYIETCRTEEFAYISSLDVDDCKSTSFSQSSSFDRITVIDKQEDFSDICKEFEKKLVQTRNLIKGKNNVKGQTKTKSQNKKLLNNNVLKASGTKEKNNQLAIANRNELKAHSKVNKDLHKLTDNNSYGNRDSLVSSNIVDNFQCPDEYEKTLSCNVTEDEKINNLPYNIVSSTQTDQCTSGRIINSGNSGSSKRGLSKFNFKKGNERTSLNTVQQPSTDFTRQISGITKVVLSKGRDIASSKPYETSKRKPRSVTTMPSTFIMPKLTQTDIRRKLANIKFPVVILGKDQLSSTIEVTNYELPQFSGLDEHIWPFMLEWSNQNIPEKVENVIKNNIKGTDSDINKRRNTIQVEHNINNLKKFNNETYLNKPLINKDRKAKNTNALIYRKVLEQKPVMPTAEIKTQKSKNLKPICQLKDKMLKLIYKNSAQNFKSEESKSRQNTAKHGKSNNGPKKNGNIEKKVDVSTETDINCNLVSKNKSTKNITHIIAPVVNRKMAPARPWAKTKWASDFIENVIRKIKNGVYYNHENEDSHHKYTNTTKEVSMQTPPNLFPQNYDQSLNSTSDETVQKLHLKTLPGFDDTLPALEIKTLNTNEITVKHCLMNVVVQFDVTVPTDPNHVIVNVKKSSSCIPITVTDSQTKIFKCKTTIFNAMLPAEICSILPKMMRKLIDCNEKSTLSLIPIDKTNSQLTTISEMSQCENIEPIQITISSDMYISPEVKRLLNGQFVNKPMKSIRSSYTFTNNIIKTSNCIWSLVTELLPKLSRKMLLFFEVIPILPMTSKAKNNNVLTTSKSNENLFFAKQNVSHCTTLQSYMTSTKKIIFTFNPYSLMDMLNKITIYPQLNVLSYIHRFEIRPDTEIIRMNMVLTENSEYVDKTVLFNVTHLKIDSLYKCLTKRKALENEIIDVTNNPLECIDNHHFDKNKTCKKEYFRNRNQLTNNNKNRKKNFVTLYKKCKSTSNISGERCFTSLNKITNLDDFVQILGSGKSLSSVLDGHMERKILSSLIEMKSWITEMSSRQALLVLLLMNKKETANLVRFRPIILQGIAVNRITRASELEMEIEVIERENFNKFSQYEGISYLSASIENHDNLLEELYWIAKTTASDYQRPFDESSEKLLRSLLEKRKKLNPSYLRVMARYVGLGLLKQSNKN